MASGQTGLAQWHIPKGGNGTCLPIDRIVRPLSGQACDGCISRVESTRTLLWRGRFTASSFNPEPEATVIAASGSVRYGRRLRLGVKRGGRTFQSGRGKEHG